MRVVKSPVFWALIILAALIVACGSWAVVTNVRQASNDEAPVVTVSTRTPDETAPDASYVWKGSASDPKKITIESIGVDAYLQNVGVDQDDLIAVPNNIHIGGWFVESVRPGDAGLSIIDGHVDGVTSNNAIFSNLAQVSAGDTVAVTLGGGKTHRYEVVRLVETAVADAPALLYSQDPDIRSQLTLITCTGNYSGADATYDKRLLVITKLI